MKYAFTHGKLLDGTKDMQVQEGLCVLTDGERISAIVPDGTPLDGYTVVDLQGRYLMPGLINMHVHQAAASRRKSSGTTKSWSARSSPRR